MTYQKLHCFGAHTRKKDGLRGSCRQCEAKCNAKYIKKNKHKVVARYKKYWHAANSDKNRHAVLIIQHLRRKCRQQKIKFNLVATDIVIPEYCPALGIKLERCGGNNSPSIDRINPKKGYVRGNIIVVSLLANMIKSVATSDQIRAVANFYERLGV